MRATSLMIKCLYAVLTFIVGYFYFIHFKFAYNFPYSDEFRTICTVIIDYVNAGSLKEKLGVLFINENESLQLFLKLANITFFEIFGEIRYNLLGYIGQISLLGFPLVVYFLNKDSETLWFDIALTILIVFNLQYYVLSFRHDTSFYYHVGLLGVIFSVYFWIKGNYKLMLAFFLLGIFNNTSSVLVLPVFILDYIFSAKNIKLKYLLIGGAAFGLVIFFFYLINPILFWLPEGWEVTSKAFLIILGNIVEFKFSFASEKPYLLIGPIYLLFILFTFYYYLFKSKLKDNRARFYALMAMYFFISIVVIAIKRSVLYHHLNTLLDPRYKMFTFPLLLFLILLWSEMFSLHKRIKWAIVIAFVWYNILYMFDSVDYRRFLYQAARINSISLKEGIDVIGPTHLDFAPKIYNRLDSIGIAPGESKEVRELHNFIKSITIDSVNTPKFTAEVSVSRYEDLGHYHTVQRVIADSESKDSFIFLKSDKDVFLFPIDFYLKNSTRDWIKSGNYMSDTFYCHLFLSVLKEGVYFMGLVTKEKNGSYSIKIYPEKTIIDDKVLNLTDEIVK